jgi:hypothetical protein
VMSHFIDSEPSCHGEATGEQVWKHAMTKEYQYILKKMMYEILFRDQKGSMWSLPSGSIRSRM